MSSGRCKRWAVVSGADLPGLEPVEWFVSGIASAARPDADLVGLSRWPRGCWLPVGKAATTGGMTQPLRVCATRPGSSPARLPLSRCARLAACLAAAVAFLAPVGASAAQTALIPEGALWRYLDDGSDQGSAWTAKAFDDGAWASGAARLGYGDPGMVTTVGFGPDPGDKFTTTYFRRAFDVADPSPFINLNLRLLRDDGAIVYLNGAEVVRSNLPLGPVDFTTQADATVGGSSETTFFEFALDPADLDVGENVVAVEVHQASSGSSDLAFDLELVAGDGGPDVTRGPYLQQGSDEAIVVRWRTDVATDARVSFGASPETLTTTVDEAAVGLEHEVALDGLAADTVYFYAVGSTTEVLAGGDDQHFFRTTPVAGTPVDTRIWVLGDSGTANASAEAVRNAYRGLAESRAADFMVMLGDNAYDTGTDEEYQAAVFEMYDRELRSMVLWPALGNHDAISSDSGTQSGPYFDAFTLPTAGEAGGEPSGTEAYYSFDYGDIHFVCLDSHDSDRSVDGAMLSWLEADLTASTARWLVAFWHHPPYSKGSHDSDSEGRLIDMRENALPILEAFGVDLVLAGHSHAYERSALLDFHYGNSASLLSSMILDAGDGDPLGDGSYVKSIDRLPHEGAVYAVAGSSGQVSGSGALDHPAMIVSLREIGSLVLDVSDDIMDVMFVDGSGFALDAFRIEKTRVPDCGDGVVDPGEDCDDGNLEDGDCCPVTCSFAEPCRDAGASLVKMAHSGDAGRDRLLWKWSRGQATELSDYGDPLAGAAYRVCLESSDGLGSAVTTRLDVPEDPSGWRASGSRALLYKDGAGISDGIRALRLGAGEEGRARIILNGKGAALGLPDAIGPDDLLPVGEPFTIRLVSADDRCWSSRFLPGHVRTNTAERFKAKATSALP